jgi:hypothetical protein
VVGKKMAGVATLNFLSFQLKTACKCQDKSRSPPGMTTRKANATTQSKCNNTKQMQKHKANATTKQMQQQSKCNNKTSATARTKQILPRCGNICFLGFLEG